VYKSAKIFLNLDYDLKIDKKIQFLPFSQIFKKIPILTPLNMLVSCLISKYGAQLKLSIILNSLNYRKTDLFLGF